MIKPGDFKYRDGVKYLCIHRIGKKLVFIRVIGDMIYKTQDEAQAYFDNK